MIRKGYEQQGQCVTCRYGGHEEKGCMGAGCTPRYAPQENCPLYAMSAQAFMQRVINAQRRIVSMEENAARYRDMAIRSTGSLQGVVHVKGSLSKVEEGMSVFMDICRDMEREAAALRGYIREVQTILNRLTDVQEREVLELRYLNGLGWQDVADRMFMHERNVRRIHIKALEHVQREMDVMEYAVHRPGWNPGGAAVKPAQYLQ